MKDFLPLLVMLILGPGFLWLGIRNLRTRAWHGGVPLIELMIDRAARVEPPPRDAADRRFSRVNAWLMVVFGSFFSLAFVASLYSIFATE